LAAGFLALDGVLLVLAGVWSNRAALSIWGAVFLAAAVTVVVMWRRHVRRLEELRADMDARRIELEALRRALEDPQE
jgi:membrane protein implicated in regulation of membrane protease activity